MSNIDTHIQHVTKPGANLFAELGFPPSEAKRLQTQSRARIDLARTLKEQMMDELAGWIAQCELRQDEAAAILHVTRPRVSDVVNHKTAKFTLDALVGILGRIGKPVQVRVG